jgi:hypothetical protein
MLTLADGSDPLVASNWSKTQRPYSQKILPGELMGLGTTRFLNQLTAQKTGFFTMPMPLPARVVEMCAVRGRKSSPGMQTVHPTLVSRFH